MSGMNAAREAEVWRILDRVADPELDEPITEMGFVEAVDIVGDAVAVAFRLPTYWCSPNFAFLMAEGIHREVSALPWVDGVTVTLQDHCFADELNGAVNGRRSFADAFAALGEGGDLAAVRAKFDLKAFQRRQEALLVRLRALGHSDADIVAMRVGRLEVIDLAGGARLLERYRESPVTQALGWGSDDLAFRTSGGAALTEAGLKDHIATLRQVRINMEFNGALCRGLKDARYKEVEQVGGEPTLVDFILGRVPPSHGPSHACDSR